MEEEKGMRGREKATSGQGSRMHNAEMHKAEDKGQGSGQRARRRKEELGAATTGIGWRAALAQEELRGHSPFTSCLRDAAPRVGGTDQDGLACCVVSCRRSLGGVEAATR
ncbi:hypothetical protein TgHK011_005851 [Trichoderma gracile]|nr:hypothetical protein TgHK011_005851 [Trichoderma gracile]